MSKLVKADPFTAALTTIERDMPETFTLEVDEHVMSDVSSLAEAHRIAGTMERMKSRARDLGYDVTTTHDSNNFRWVYHFQLRPGAAKPKAEPALELPAGAVVVAALEDSKSSE